MTDFKLKILSNLAVNLIYDHYSEQSKSSSSTINTNSEPIIKNSSINKSSTPGSPTNFIKPKPQASKLSSVNNLFSNESIQREIALNLLEGKSRSLSSSTVENHKNENIEFNKKTHDPQMSNEDLLKLESSVKKTYQSSLPWINILNLNQDDVERAWKSHIHNMLNSSKQRTNSNRLELEAFGLSKNFNPIESFYLFKKLFVKAKYKLNNLLSECFQYLTIETKLFLKLEKHLVMILDLLKNKLDCPVVYFDLEWFMQVQEMLQSTLPNKNFGKSPLKVTSLISTSFIDNHRRILWEIGENYDTFVYIKHDITDKFFIKFLNLNLERKPLIQNSKQLALIKITSIAKRSLESIKKLDKNSNKSNHGSSEINSKIEKFFKKIELSKKFCKLVSQFMILLQSYSKLFPNLTRNLSNTTLTDLSVEMSNLKRCLKVASCELEQNGRLSPMFPVDLEKTLHAKSPSFKTILPNSKEMIVYWILEAIRQENYTQTIEFFKIAQKNWPNDFNRSNNSDNDIEFDSILVLVCEQARQKNSNMIAIIEPDSDFIEISQTILQEVIEITNLVNLTDKKFKENISSVLNDNDNDDYDE
ncbi:furry -like protein [Brachionus plicatilis]|uniref:Furry-like protein n=1 Tax=Brachionus plicatilis TaxID=10195 RepID=A0A3M7S663_BRAPC|nr:furry -like protein [Brachionus plicatilis]